MTRRNQVQVVKPLEDPRWITLSLEHPRASVFHSVEWLKALQKTYGYEPLAYTSTPPGAPLSNAVVFCRVSSWLTGQRLVSLPFSDHCEPLVEGVDQRRPHELHRDPDEKGKPDRLAQQCSVKIHANLPSSIQLI